MFPLGTVLLPHQLLRLHVFEPRYRALVHDCLAGDPAFGVVLIERGSEVGGGDVRTDVGTLARIVQAAELPDGRWVLATVGTERIAVREWLPDDPYPLAEIEVLTDVPAGAGAADAVDDLGRRLRACLARRVELGEQVSVVDELDPDPAIATFQAAALAGLVPTDARALLRLDAVDERLAAVARLLEEQLALLDFRLRGA
jgi:Lon protease-like protein